MSSTGGRARRGVSRWGRLGRLVAVAVVGLSVLLLQPSPASAHSELQRSDPLDGGIVAVGRTRLTLWFGEEVSGASSSFTVRAQDGTQVPVDYDRTGGATTVIDLNAADPLPRGVYTLDWRVFSLEDGHTTSGTIAFGAGIRPQSPATQRGELPPVALVLLRWVDLSGLVVALGCVAVGATVRRGAGAGARRRLHLLGVAGASVALYAGVVTPFVRTFDPTQGLGLWWDQTWLVLTQTPSGRMWSVREAALLGALLALVRWGRHATESTGSTASARVAGAALVAASAAEAWSGHAAAAPASLGAGLAATAHLVAAGAWVGGLAVLLVCLLPGRGRRVADTCRDVWRAWSPVAAVASGVLLASGLYLAGVHVPDVAALVSTGYGVTVALKVGLVLLALALAGRNTLVVHPGLGRRLAARGPAATRDLLTRLRPQLGRTVRVEVGVLAVAMLLGALLTSSPSARESVDAQRRSTVHSDVVGGLFVTFEQVPAGPGAVRLVVRMRAVQRPQPAPVTGIDVALAGPGGDVRTVSLAATEPGRYEAATAAPAPGRSTAVVAVHRQGLVDVTTSSGWTVPRTSQERTGPFVRAMDVLAGLVLLALLVSLAFVVRLRRGTGPPPGPEELHDDPVQPDGSETTTTTTKQRQRQRRRDDVGDVGATSGGRAMRRTTKAALAMTVLSANLAMVGPPAHAATTPDQGPDQGPDQVTVVVTLRDRPALSGLGGEHAACPPAAGGAEAAGPRRGVPAAGARLAGPGRAARPRPESARGCGSATAWS